MLIYDCEIKKLIPKKGEPQEPGFDYCGGWGDHAGMGISVVSVFDDKDGFPRIFMDDNLHEMFELMEEADIIVGFNSKGFDNKLLAANGYVVPDEKTFDLYLEIKEAAGAHKYAKGYNLDNCCHVNLGYQKSGDGALAPKLWQEGKTGTVVNYALRDIILTQRLMAMCMKQPIIDPGNTGSRIFVRNPLESL